MEVYAAAAKAVADRLIGALALSLDMPADGFDAFRRQPLTVLRLLHYPPQPATPGAGEKRRGRQHTDFGALTLLLPGRPRRAAGLRSTTPTRWIHADPGPGPASSISAT